MVKNATDQRVDGQDVYGWSERRSADSPVCTIQLNPSLFIETAADIAGVVLHEVWHCFQWDHSYQGVISAAAWITEGQAEYASGAVLRSVGPVLTAYYDEWLATPGTRLFSRAYDAVGFYATLADAGLSPLSSLLQMYDAGWNGATYQFVTSGESSAMTDQWASSYADDPDYGSEWWLDQRQMSAHDGNAATEVLAFGLQSITLTTNAYTVTLSTLEPHADVMHFTVSGSARISDRSFGGSVDLAGVADATFCSMDAMNRTGCRSQPTLSTTLHCRCCGSVCWPAPAHRPECRAATRG